jgi:hypothetical protein
LDGFQGFQGAAPTGPTGFDGSGGAQGANPTGFQGVLGAIGRQGAQRIGNDGFQGTTGLQGFTGASPTGNQGAQGAQGSTGSQGFQGTASLGAQGNQGLQGLQGAVGSAPTGAQGVQGSQGLQGFQGSSGVAGGTGLASGAWSKADANVSVTTGDTVKNTTVEGAFVDNTVLTNNTAYSGMVLHVWGAGTITTKLAGDTLALRLYFNFGAGNQLLLGSSTVISLPGNQGQWSYFARFAILVYTTGATGTIEVQGHIRMTPPSSGSTTERAHFIANTGALTFDSTVDNTIGMTAQWGAQNASNNCTQREFVVDSENQ